MNIFELMYVAWRRERLSTKIEALEEDFYKRIKPYISHLESQYKNETDPLISMLFKRRWERANYLLNDLISIRMEKHFQDSLAHIPSPDQLPEEERYYRENISKIQMNFRDAALSLEEKPLDVMEEHNEYEFIIFSANEDTIAVGSDFYEYGPFAKDDLVLMPQENLRNYVLKSKGEEISLKK